jgi:hypothetical protein
MAKSVNIFDNPSTFYICLIGVKNSLKTIQESSKHVGVLMDLCENMYNFNVYYSCWYQSVNCADKISCSCTDSYPSFRPFNPRPIQYNGWSILGQLQTLHDLSSSHIPDSAAQVGTVYTCGICDRPRQDSPAACVVAQQYSSAAFLSVRFQYLLTYLLTYSTEQSPSWEANQFSASQ